MANDPGVVQFDLGEEKPSDVEQYALEDTDNKQGMRPEVLQERAEKYAFATGKSALDLERQLETEGDRALRESEAASESFKIRQAQNRLLVDYARKLDRPLTNTELDEIDAFTKQNYGLDPDTVLEESYGRAFSNLAIDKSRDKQTDSAVMAAMPDATLDGLDAVGRQVARRELATTLLQDLAHRHEQSASDLTPGNFFSELGTFALESLNPFVFDQTKRYSKAPSLDLVGDYGEIFLPGYANVKLGGWDLNLGDSLAEQYREFLLLPPSEFKKKFGATVEALAEDNLPLAMQYAHGFLKYSNSDRVLDQIFGYADWLSVAGGLVSSLRKGKNLLRDIKPLERKPKESAEPPEIKTQEEAVEEVQAFAKKLRDTAKAANAPTAEESLSTLGDLDAAASMRVHKDLTEDIKELDPFGDTVQLRDKVPNLFAPGGIGDDMGSLSLGRVNKHRAHATANANKLLRVIKNNNNVTRLNPGQIEEAIRASKEQMLKDYDRVDDAILDVTNGGPFRTYTPDEQLVNIYTNELRLGKVPEPPQVPSKTAIQRNPNAVDELLEYLRVEKTTHKNSSQTRNNVAQGYNDLIGEYHKAVQAGSKESFLDFVNAKKGVGGLFDQAVEAITTRTGKPLSKGQLNRLQKEIGLGPTPTGDVFIDRINAVTARRGKVLVRDLYDSLKRQKKFDGTLGDFRQKIKELRKARKIKMSPFKSGALRPNDLPKPAPPRKPKNAQVTKKQPVEKEKTFPATVQDIVNDMEATPPFRSEVAIGSVYDEFVKRTGSSLSLEDFKTELRKNWRELRLTRLDDPKAIDKNLRERSEILQGKQKSKVHFIEKRQPQQRELDLEGKPQVPRETVQAVVDDFAQRLYETVASLRVGNPVTGKVKFRLPGTKRDISVSNFPDLAKRAVGKFRRDTAQALEAGILTPKAFQGIVDEWSDFASLTRKRVPVAKGSKKLGEFDIRKEIGKRSQSQKAEFDVNEGSLEEGNYGSEFKRDIGYGNETYRNRIIDSEILTAKSTKTKTAQRYHYIEPPAGFGPQQATPKKPLPNRPQQYPQSAPDNDAELMMALTELQQKLAKTNNNKLYDRIAKYLHLIERRNLGTSKKAFNEDQRVMDLGDLGSPYSTLPLPSDTVERRVLRKGIPKGYQKITAEEFLAKRKAGQQKKTSPQQLSNVPKADNDIGFAGLAGTQDAVTARRQATDPAFVGRDYSKRPELPPSQKRLSKKDRSIYDALEREAYSHLNSLEAAGKVSKTIKVGKPSALLFKKRQEAAYWGTEVYGLNPNQYKIKQQGSGFYISIPRIVDETNTSVRDLRVTPGNSVDTGLTTALLGWGIAPDNYVDALSKFNRAVVTYLPQEMHRLIQESAEQILKLPQKERDQVNDMLISHRDRVFVDDDGKVRRGTENQTLGGFEREFYDRFSEMPSENQIDAYFDYVRLMDMDLALRDFHLVRDMGRLGYEKTVMGYHLPSATEGQKPERAASRPFATKQIDKLPFESGNVEDWGVFVYNPHTRSGQFTLRSDATPEIREHIEDLTTNHGFRILQVGNPLEKPVKGIAKTEEIVNFLIVKDFSRVKYDFSNIPRRPGGHIRYQDEVFAKQPRMRQTKSGWIYEGDETFLNFTTVAQAKKYVPRIERARKLLKEGRETELENYLSKNLPFTLEEFKSHFLPKTLEDGTEVKPRFSLDHEFTFTTAGKNTFDMSHFKSREGKYEGFRNAIRSEYNDFAAWVDKKFLGQRDPDVPAMQEFKGQGGKPVMSLGKPRLIDPWEMVNNSLSNIVRSRYMNDIKIQAAEQFVEQFAKVMKTPLEELRRNPIFYLHNPVWETATDSWATLQAGKHFRQATLHLIGADSNLGKAMNYVYEKMSDGLYTAKGQGTADKFTDRFRNAKNPIDLARGGVFHAKLGMLNPVQYLVQGSAVTHAAAIKGWGKMLPAYAKSWAARLLNLTEDPKMVRGMADFMSERMKSLGGFNADEFVEGFEELKKTGFYNVGGEYANRDDFFDPKVFGSKTGKYLDKSAFFFTEGERSQRVTAWFVAFNEWKTANPGKTMTNSERAKVLEQAHFLTNRMARNSNANIQNGSFAVTFQFLSYQWRMAEAILGKSLTRGEKARVLLTYSALYGIPVGGSAAVIYPFYDDFRQRALEEGIDMDDLAVKTLHDGVVSTLGYLLTGETYNFGERFGPSGLSTVKEMFDEDKSFLELLGGAVGSVAGDIIKSTDAAYNAVMNFMDPTHAPPTTSDFVEALRNISSFNNAYRAYYMLNTKSYFTKNDTLVTEDNTAMDAFMAMFAGVAPSDVGDTFLMLKSLKEQRQAQQEARIEATKYLRRMMYAREDGDWGKVDANLRLAKAILIAGGVREKDYGDVLRQAYKGHESLFERALQKFVEQAPPDQMQQRLERATEKLDKLR